VFVEGLGDGFVEVDVAECAVVYFFHAFVEGQQGVFYLLFVGVLLLGEEEFVQLEVVVCVVVA
jgi:hypothetical protein